MKRVRIYPRSKRRRDEEWSLELGDDAVAVVDARDRVVGGFDPEDAAGRIRFPSFWDSVKHFGVQLDDGSVEDFDLSAKARAAVERYLQDVALDAGPAAVRAVLRTGWLMVAGGTVAAVGGTVVSVLSVRAAADGGGSYVITWGAVVFGLALICKGAYNLRQHAQLVRLAADRDADDDS